MSLQHGGGGISNRTETSSSQQADRKGLLEGQTGRSTGAAAGEKDAAEYT